MLNAYRAAAPSSLDAVAAEVVAGRPTFDDGVAVASRRIAGRQRAPGGAGTLDDAVHHACRRLARRNVEAAAATVDWRGAVEDSGGDHVLHSAALRAGLLPG